MWRLLFASLCLLASVASARRTGARLAKDIGSDEVQSIANEVVKKLNHRTNGMYHRRLAHVVHAQSQLVAGILWHLDFVWGDTTCKKSQLEHFRDVTEDRCPFKPDGKAEHCYVTYLVQEWVHQRSIEKIECETTDHESLVVHDAHEELHKDILTKTNSIAEADEVLSKVKLHQVDRDMFMYGLEEFEDYMQLFNKSYPSRAEKMRRLRIFQVNMWIARQLQQYEKGSATYGATPFSDMSLSEFRKHLLSPAWRDIGYPTTYAEIPREAPPASWDWRSHNAVTPVKNQGMCGSCWAFSTTGNIEGQWAIKKGKLVSLSEQELVDCDTIDDGCNGGLPSQAYQAIMNIGGLETEKQYPYDARGEQCVFKKSESAAYINSSVKISKDEKDMASWLFKNGPISIGINAMPMMFYMGGIAHPWKIFCNPSHIDHGVLIVGYGTSEKNEPYWIIKNSWGPSWGREGYYYIYRGDGSCGVNLMATSAVVA